jgi:hypothetical protein
VSLVVCHWSMCVHLQLATWRKKLFILLQGLSCYIARHLKIFQFPLYGATINVPAKSDWSSKGTPLPTVNNIHKSVRLKWLLVSQEKYSVSVAARKMQFGGCPSSCPSFPQKKAYCQPAVGQLCTQRIKFKISIGFWAPKEALFKPIQSKMLT